MCRNRETEKRRARGRETAERASVVKRYIDISRLIVLAISHARALHLAKKQAASKKQVQYRGAGLDPTTCPSLSLISRRSLLLLLLLSLLQAIAWTLDSWRGCTFGIGDGDNPRADPIGYGSPEDAKRPRSTLRCFLVYSKWGQATEWSTPCRFAPRLVAPNHNETCQGAYLRGHLKSDFYLYAPVGTARVSPSFLFFSFFFRVLSRGPSTTRYHTVIPRYKWFRSLSRSKRRNDGTVFYFLSSTSAVSKDFCFLYTPRDSSNRENFSNYSRIVH